MDWQSGNCFLREMEVEVQVLRTARSNSTRETRTETFILLPSSQRAKRLSFTRVKIKTYDQKEANMYLVIQWDLIARSSKLTGFVIHMTVLCAPGNIAIQQLFFKLVLYLLFVSFFIVFQKSCSSYIYARVVAVFTDNEVPSRPTSTWHLLMLGWPNTIKGQWKYFMSNSCFHIQTSVLITHSSVRLHTSCAL